MDFRSSYANASGSGQPTNYSPASATNSSPHQQGILAGQSPMSYNRSFQSSTLDRLLQPGGGSGMAQGTDTHNLLGMDGSYGRPVQQQQQTPQHPQAHTLQRRDSHLSSARSGHMALPTQQQAVGDAGGSSTAQHDALGLGAPTAKRGSKACVPCKCLRPI